MSIFKSKRYIFVYKTTNLINNKIYVGIHRTNDLNDGYLGSGVALCNAIEKYGRDMFNRIILEYCDENILEERERHWIMVTGSFNKEIGYNLTLGGCISPLHTEDTIQRIKEQRGWKHTDETKKKLSEIRTGTQASAFTKKKISIAHKDRKYSEEHINSIVSANKKKMESGVVPKKISESLKCVKKTEVHKINISLAKIGVSLSGEHKKSISDTLMGHIVSDTTRRKLSKALTGYKHIKRVCPYCGKVGAGGNMTRYHFDNCKNVI